MKTPAIALTAIAALILGIFVFKPGSTDEPDAGSGRSAQGLPHQAGSNPTTPQVDPRHKRSDNAPASLREGDPVSDAPVIGSDPNPKANNTAPPEREAPGLANILSRHQSFFNSYGQPTAPALRDLGVPEKAVREVYEILGGKVEELKAKLVAKNPTLRVLEVGPEFQVVGLDTKDISDAVQSVRGMLETVVSEELADQIADAFSGPAAVYGHSWTVSARVNQPDGLTPFGGGQFEFIIVERDRRGRVLEERNSLAAELDFIEFKPPRSEPPKPAPPAADNAVAAPAAGVE